MVIVDTESSETTYTPSMNIVIPNVLSTNPVDITEMLMVGEVEVNASEVLPGYSNNMIVYSGNIGVMTSQKSVTELRMVVTEVHISDETDEKIAFVGFNKITNNNIQNPIKKSVYFRANTGPYSTIASGQYRYKLYVAQVDDVLNVNTIMNDTCLFNCTSHLL